MDNNSFHRIFLGGLGLSMVAISFSTIDLNLAVRGFLCALTVLFTCFYLLQSTKPIQVKLNFITTAYCLYLFWTVISGYTAVSTSEYLYQSVRDFLWFSIFLFAVIFFSDPSKFFHNELSKTVIISNLIYLCAGSFQLLRLPDMQKESMYAVVGLHAHKNLFSSYLLLSLFFLFYRFKHFNLTWKALAVITIAGSLFFIFILRTKAVWLGMMSMTILFIIIRFLKWRKWQLRASPLIVAVLMVVLFNGFLMVVLPNIIEGFLNQENQTMTSQKANPDEERLVLWQKTFSMINKHLLKGVGGGNWQIHFPDETLTGIWRAEDMNVSFQRPHNDLLWIAAEHGLVGLSLYLFFILSFIFYLLKIYLNDEGNNTLLLFALVFIVGYMTASYFDFPRERVEHNILIYLLLAWSYVEIKKKTHLKALFSYNVSLFHFSAWLVILLFITMITYLRYEGEKSTRLMYAARDKEQPQIVIAEGGDAKSVVYTIDPLSIPIDWYKGNAFIATGDLEKGSQALLDAYHANPYNRNVLNDLGSAYAAMNEPVVAKKFYREAARISPRFDDAKLNLVAVYINEKNYDAADSCLKTLLHESERRSQYRRITDARP